MVWACLILPAVLFLMNLGGAPLFDVDEGAFSEATREMFERGDFLSTWLNGAPRFDKPILIYWCQAVFVWLLGPTEWAFRLPSAIAATFWAQQVGIFAWKRFGRDAGLLACGMVATSLGPHIIGRAATADALLNMLLALALMDGWRHLEDGRRAPLLRSYLWIGLGALTKGPIALLVPGATTLLFALSSKRFSTWLRSVFDPLGWVILLAITVPWYAAALSIHGQAFIDGFILKHNVQRFSGSLEGHSGSLFYYVLMIPLLVLPWMSWMLRSLKEIPADFKQALPRFLWLWFIFVTAFFSLSGTKLPHYALYGSTPLFLLMALHRDRIRQAWIGLLPTLVLLAVIIATPTLIEHSLAAGWVKNGFYIAQLSRVTEVVPAYFYPLAFAVFLAVVCVALFTKFSPWLKTLTAASVVTLLISVALTPLIGELLQGPVKQAGLIAHAMKTPAIMWNFHAPSFSVYKQGVTPAVQARSGDLALTRTDRLPTDVSTDILFRSGGVVLVKVK